MKSTTNYQLVKQELIDKPDITQIAGNWDTIDTQLKNLSDGKFDKTGGTISGAVTITGKLTANGSIDASSLFVTGGATFASPIKITNSNIIQSQVPVTRGTNPNSMQYSHWSVYDQGGHSTATNRLGRVQYSINTDGTATMAMYVNKFSTVGSEEIAGITAQWGTDGKAKVSILHDPEQSANDRQLATTKWVKGLTATTSQRGLVRLASESDILNETDKTVMDVPSTYKLHDFRRISTAYSVGDKVNCAFKFEWFLECTKAGTTSSQTLDTRNVSFGQTITDGSVKWVVRAHARSVDGVVPDKDGNVRCIYRSVESLGLSQNTNTIVDVYKALPNNGAIFFDYINGANVESFGVPTNGVLKIFKDNGSACVYMNKYGGTTDAWYANIGSETTVETIKWQKIVTIDSLRTDIKSTVLDIFFPVGSIYMDATGKINPNTQFGGTWAKIENVFLLASGSKSVGSTGGAENVTLTTNQMPKHGHNRGTMNMVGSVETWFGTPSAGTIRSTGETGVLYTEGNAEAWPVKGESSDVMATSLLFRADRSWGGTTTEVGEGQAHNNMPPYRVVAVWRRTA